MNLLRVVLTDDERVEPIAGVARRVHCGPASNSILSVLRSTPSESRKRMKWLIAATGRDRYRGVVEQLEPTRDSRKSSAAADGSAHHERLVIQTINEFLFHQTISREIWSAFEHWSN